MYYNKLASQTFFFGLIYYVKKLKTISVIIVFYPSKVKHHNFATHQRYIKSSFCIKHKKGYNFALKAARKKKWSKACALKLCNVKSWDSRGLRCGKFFFSVIHFSGMMIETYIALEKAMRMMFYKGQNYIQIIVIPKPSTACLTLSHLPKQALSIF